MSSGNNQNITNYRLPLDKMKNLHILYDMDDENEIWKIIPGFPDYEVSNMGRVKSYKRKKPAILKPGTNRGYRFVNLRQNNKSVNKRVAHLVLLAFIGDRPKDTFVCHYNDIKTDDRLENLRYDTRQANVKDSIRNNGGIGPKSSLTSKQIKQTREAVNSNREYSSIAQELDISYSSVSIIAKNLGKPTPTDLIHQRAEEIRQLYATGKYTQQQIADQYEVSISAVCRIINHQRASNKKAIYPLKEKLPIKRKNEKVIVRTEKVLLSLNPVEKEALDNIADHHSTNGAEALRILIREYAQQNGFWPNEIDNTGA